MEITASSLTIGYAFTHAIHARARDRDLFLRNRTERRKTRGRPIERGRREGEESERDRRYSGPRRRIQEEKRTYARALAHIHTSYVPRAIIQAAITRSCRVHPFSGEFFLLPFPPTPSPFPLLVPHPSPPSPPPFPAGSREISLFSSPTAMP